VGPTAIERRDHRTELDARRSGRDGGERNVRVEDLGDSSGVQQVVPEEDAVPASRFGHLGQFDEPMGIGHAVKGREK